VAALLAETSRKENEKKAERERQKSRDVAKRPRKGEKAVDSADDYYGPADAGEHSSTTAEDKQKPNFGLSGALAVDESGGGGSSMYKGVLLKFQEPPEARTPNTLWRFYVFKRDKQIDTLHVSKQSAYLWGRNEAIADIPLQHPSCSSQHAVLQYRALPSKETGKMSCQPYLMDLESTNGTFINGVRIEPARYYQLKRGDVLKFGASTREYVLLTANTTTLK
jgi:smad nuclear-interacting protein 1